MKKEDQTGDFSYQEAIDELREIVKGLQGNLEDIEQLESKMKRASVLIQFCRRKIQNVQTTIDDIVNEINNTESSQSKED